MHQPPRHFVLDLLVPARTGVSSNLQLCFTEASDTSLSNVDSNVSSSPLMVTVSSRHEHGCHKAVIVNSTRTSTTIRECFALTFLLGLPLFSCSTLKLDRTHWSAHCLEPQTVTTVSNNYACIATLEGCEVTIRIAKLAFHFWDSILG